MNKILSIIVPTKNRYYTLLSLLDTISTFESEEFEIVVQDNTEDNSIILDYLKSNKDKRICYFHSKENLSVIENSNLAVKHSTGEYVCFIGDDDGVMPFITDVCNWMKTNEYKVLKSFKPNYYWPDQKANYLSNETTGVLNFESFNYEIKSVTSGEALKDVLTKGGTSMQKLPCLYHGIVHRLVLDLIYAKCNSYFPGPSPDMANAVALTQFIDSYIYVGFPVVISGKSTKSTGGQGVLHKHIAKIEDVAHLPSDTSREWSTEIPKYWTGQTIWAESVIKSLQKCGSIEFKTQFRFSYLYASIIIFNYQFKDQIFKDFGGKIYTINFFIDFISIFKIRAEKFVKNRLGKIATNKHTDIKTIGEAILVLMKNINTNNLPF